MKKVKLKPLLGWREILSIPTLGVKEIRAKVDTGARTSALHVTDLKIKKRGKTTFAYFKIHPKQKSKFPIIESKAKIIEFRHVISSNGISSERPVILVDIVLGQNKTPIEITLVNRDLMGYRMLLGRTAMKGRYLVDPGKSFLQAKKGIKKIK
ncbi:MAG: ATP-dependent zinc protease [Bdellovibrionaceae bacterium]|nr:ATP-dependent zinc protease [Pseudobdellovibrionaceae bacterium]